MKAEATTTRCGTVALAGRPNVGKSTLVNALVGEKVSIVSPKPQTTRHRIQGILTHADSQWLFVDTPGLHAGAKKALNHHLNRAAVSSILAVDLILLVVEARRWNDEDQNVLECAAGSGHPLALVINKVDRLAHEAQVLPFIEKVKEQADFVFILPLSARRKDNLGALLDASKPYLPHKPFSFPKDQYTDRSERFMAAETLREKLVMALQQELPYALTVSVDDFQRVGGTIHIHATAWVERSTQKGIVIGSHGRVLKSVGEKARHDLEKRFGEKVYVRMWVKVRRDWSDDEKAIRSLGFDDVRGADA